ncbi:MAG: nickel-dependent lactate racemase [Acidimicrobiia bacterium]|nr:nickel-dependent lactate racemase [Acidimicrobiia bacterium]NNF88426.1 nickel-dependent lactate racemase [Acidimicrobiia bacterium]NNL13089.1 nickel-dependent lactate racemase [Acidimicrobiia bacterium]NNL71589.1 nickel-dependent lactate racemase [Acidimicrobiia bacterium]
MEIRLPYGHSTVSAEVPDRYGVDVIELPDPPAAADPTAEVARALAGPLGNFTWSGHEGGSVAIAVNDKTRPVPHEHLLPPLIDRLTDLGIPDGAVTFYIAVGGHPPMTREEHPAILPPEILNRFRVVSHDSEASENLVFLGETSRGTPVWANRGYVEADLKIVVGTIEPHQFVGFSGGVKSAAIGLAGLATINANHTLMAHPDSQIGTYATNPARQDVEEVGRLMGIDLALNAVLDQQRQIVQALAGDPVAVMEAGAPLARKYRQIAVEQDYRLVVCSPGGHPKDINVYQSQKAVASAARIVRPGGTIILTAACSEGSGSRHYEQWVSDKHSRAEVVEAYHREGFRIGPHKAFQIARDTERARLLVFSDMSHELTRRLLLDPADDFQPAVSSALKDLAAGERIAVLPHASSTIPYLNTEAMR